MSQFKIAKFDDAQNLVFGFANVSVSRTTAKGEGSQFYDLQKDAIPPAELEAGAYDFVLNFRESGEMHEGGATGRLVESMVFTPDKLFKFATDPSTNQVDQYTLDVLKRVFPPRWWVGFKLDPAAYKGVKEGKYSMFSVAGEADREEPEYA